MAEPLADIQSHPTSADAGALPADAPAGQTEGPRPLHRGDQNLNPPGIGFWALVREDFATHEKRWAAWGFWALLLHRYGNWRMGIRSKLLRLPFSLVYKLLFPFTELLFGIKLDYNVPVGRRLRIDHCGGMVLGARQIGDDCIVRQNTTFGIVHPTKRSGKPTLGNRVDVGTGVVILGDLVIGDDAIIGANAVVTKDIPARAVAVGIPAKVIKLRDLPPEPLEIGTTEGRP